MPPAVATVPQPHVTIDFHHGRTTHQHHRSGGLQASLGYCRGNNRGCQRVGCSKRPSRFWSSGGTCLSEDDLSGKARMSQKKMASPTLRSCCWSGVKATACTGSEWPMYTWGQHISHTETSEAWLNCSSTPGPGQTGDWARHPHVVSHLVCCPPPSLPAAHLSPPLPHTWQSGPVFIE